MRKDPAGRGGLRFLGASQPTHSHGRIGEVVSCDALSSTVRDGGLEDLRLKCLKLGRRG
ncbi:hypothetical protein Mal64_37800 [Pseudobythopirellula maris]|uniref:Uncharacterized protein n=1 Tax=Pseudobythopirellula maris TaxID=2527991 RepID=A0A5C5ZH86_9BACT|nr:hypothetical protein Mal64_37800 [Pseudobythopirellula maris]